MTALKTEPAMKPELWRAPAPVHFDSAWPWWPKLLVGLVLLGVAFFD